MRGLMEQQVVCLVVLVYVSGDVDVNVDVGEVGDVMADMRKVQGDDHNREGADDDIHIHKHLEANQFNKINQKKKKMQLKLKICKCITSG